MEGSNKRYREAGLITRQKEPKNLEAPFDRIDSYLTPTELFYIRSHFPTPSLDRASYQLRIDGAGHFGRLSANICRDRSGWLTMQSAANQSPHQIPC